MTLIPSRGILNAAKQVNGDSLSKTKCVLVSLPVIIVLLIAIMPVNVSVAADQQSYFFSNIENGDYLNIVNMGSSASAASVFVGDAFLGGVYLEPGTHGTYVNHLAGGPVRIVSPIGQPLLVNKWAAVTQYNDLPAAPEPELSDHYYYYWYNHSSPGFEDTLVVSNPNITSIYYEITINGTVKKSGVIPPNATTNAKFPGVNDGPVQIRGWTSAQKLAPANFMSSQQIRTNHGAYLSEVNGFAADRLADHYYWTWLENSEQTTGSICAINLNSSPIYYDIKIGGQVMQSGTIGPGQQIFTTLENTSGGPAEIQAWSDETKTVPAVVLAIMRTFTDGYMTDTVGTPASELNNDYYINFFDAGNSDLFLANAGDQDADVTVDMRNGSGITQFNIPADSAIAPDMNGHLGIPVVITSTQPIIASLTKDVAAPPPPGLDYYFPWYDSVGGRTWVLTAMPDDSFDNWFDIYLGDMFTPLKSMSVPAGNTTPNYFSDYMDGLVKVHADDGSAIVSERSLFGLSFEEIWATPYEELDSIYYWPVYDGIAEEGMRNWILLGNPVESGKTVNVQIRINLPAELGGDVVDSFTLPPGDIATPSYPGLRSGPVVVTATEAGSQGVLAKIVASQRVLYNGSFNEMPGIPRSRLSPFWAWTWYDNKSPGANAWICVSSPENPSLGPVYLLMIGGQSGSQMVGPVWRGETAILDFPEQIMDGPVFILGCSDGSTMDSCFASQTDIYASQRSIWGPSFSEISGITENETSTKAHWTWYDNESWGVRNWVLMANLDASPVYARVTIAGTPRWQGWIDGYANQTPTFPGIMGGPVEVEAWTTQAMTPGTEADIFASQRVLWNGYFNEIVGKGM